MADGVKDLSLTFRLRVAYQAFVHGRFIVDQPINIQILVPRDCRFTDEEIQKICSGVHDEMLGIINECDANDAR